MSERSARGWLRRLGGYVLAHRIPLILGLSGAVLGSATQALVPLVARHIVDRVILTHASTLRPWLVLLVGAALVTFFVAYLRRYYGGVLSLSVQNDLRNDMHDHLVRMDQRSLSQMPTGQLVARANSDSALVQAMLMFLPMLTNNVLLMLFSLAIMLLLSPLLALTAVVVLPALFLVSYRMRTTIFPASWEAQQREGDVAQAVDEAVNGVRIVKAFGQERRELERVVASAETLYGARMRTVRLQSRFGPLMESIPALAQVAILGLGGWMALRGSISVGTFLAFSTYVAQFSGPTRSLANILTIGQQARAGVERIFQLLDSAPTIADAPGAVDLPPRPRGEVVFQDVHFGYGDREVLRGVDLRIAPGERVAIVGASGSGKSTMASLVSRFHDPTSGSVSVDGRDLRTATLASLRRHVGVAFEDSFLFSDSVRANIAYGRPEATQDEIEEAARSAQAHEFISALPDGYDTHVGERGLTLSGGQRQRIALARAILVDPAILVLDDATSALDARTEEAIHDALRSVLRNRTTVLIAHRLSTLRLADRVAVLADGRIEEQGTHDELLVASSRYRALISGLEGEARQVGVDDVEALLEVAAEQRVGGVTESAWQAGRPRGAAAQAVAIGAPSLGAGLGPGGGGGWRKSLAPTPELLAQVAALRPVKDEVRVDVEAESRQTGEFALRTVLRDFRRPLSVGLALVVLDAVATLAGPILVRHGLDDGVAKGSGAALFSATAAFFAITALAYVNGIAETFVTGRAAERIMLSLRVRIWAQLQRLSLDYYEREMAGRIMTRMTTDVDQFESLIENGLLKAIVALITFVGVGVVLLVVNLTLGLFTLSVVVPLVVATVLFRRRSARLYDLARDRIAIANAEFQENLSGSREAQAFAHETTTIRRFHVLGGSYLRARIGAQRLIAIYFPFVQFLSAVADAIVLGVGARLVAEGRITTGVLIAFILYISMFFSPIQQLSQVFDSWQQTRISVQRVSELMALEPLVPAAADPVPAGRLHGALAVDQVHFAYPAAPVWRSAGMRGPADARRPATRSAPGKAPEALRGVDLRVRPGETVALVGETGAGKSTVMKLLARFYDPGTGAVLADGHDLRTLDLHEYRTQLGYVPQESFLFSGTIRDNVAYGRPSATDAEVEAAARAVGAHDFIAGLPGGYLHELSERGQSLSSGQRQLLALARADLVDPAILLLDEATSNLDLVTEARVSEAMQRLAARRTTIIIAHRLQTARGADRIVVLDNGTVAEVGSHEELLEANGRYARMWRAFETVAS